MKTLIAFADLTYTQKGFSSTAFPYAGAIVASYAKKKFGDNISVELFKYPDDFINYLENNVPNDLSENNKYSLLESSNENVNQGNP